MFDPMQVDCFEVKAFLKSLMLNEYRNNAPVTKQHVIEVCYDEGLEDALLRDQSVQENDKLRPNDLSQMSQTLNMAVPEIIQMHSEQVYRVFTVGFLPNFAYMGFTIDALHIPRLSSPRKAVPAGAVAIADNQTAIYPQRSPGGWHILGYCPFDLSGQGDTVFSAGDEVVFKPISIAEYQQKYGALTPRGQRQ
jgi:allophanate hydrolase subunit 1